MSKKYEYSANNFTHDDSIIKVCVSIASQGLKLPILHVVVSVEKKEGKDIEYYRCEAIKKAKEVIADIAEDAVLNEPHQNTLEERVTALEKQLTGMQAAMSCDINALSSRVSDIEFKAN